MRKYDKFTGVFIFLCFLYLSSCGKSVSDWERLYSTDTKDAEATEDADEVKSDVSEAAEEADGDTSGVTDAAQNDAVAEKEDDSQKNEETEVRATVVVHVCGAVVSPGVYELPEGARVHQAIEAAGGLTEEADLLLVNQARVVEDGEQIRIYTKEEAASAEIPLDKTNEPDTEAKININTADVELLMTLPGIGEAKAAAIIDYRKSHGDFEAISDIMNIPGIKEAVFTKIKEKITV